MKYIYAIASGLSAVWAAKSLLFQFFMLSYRESLSQGKYVSSTLETVEVEDTGEELDRSNAVH